MGKKTTDMTLRIPNRTAMALDEIANVAGTQSGTVVKVMLALYVGAWIQAKKPASNNGEDQ